MMAGHYHLALALLCCLPLACGGRSVVKGPEGDSDDSVSTPTASSDDGRPTIAPRDVNPPDRKGVGRIPFTKPQARKELRHIAAEIAGDEPGEDRGRVKEEESTSGSITTVVNLTNCNVRDADLARLKLIPRIRVLSLASSEFLTGSGLVHLRQLDELQELSLSSTFIGDEGLANLKGMTQLVKLNLFKTPITDAGLAPLATCTGLRTLMVHQTAVSDAGLAHLAKLPKLEDVWLQGTRVTEKGLRLLEAARPGIKLRHRLRTRRSR